MFRWAVICLIISLIAGGLGLTSISVFAKRLSLIFFALFFLGFLALIGFAWLVGSADDVAAALRKYRELGITHFVLSDTPYKQEIVRIGDQLLDLLR